MPHILATPLGRTGLAALTLLTLGGASAQAQTGLAVSGDSLYTLNLATGTATLVGSNGLPNDSLQGLAIAPNGSIFGTGQTGLLYSLSATTGAATLIGDTGRGDIEGLDFFGNTLVGTDNSFTTTFFSINTATAAATDIT
ncbi:MAG: hypothetical protein M3Y13_06995, partial [Armatimonadota bacterium]|nr:hypothetical protein [Armatimonadota bacterium]